jgi:hypothetical protein
MDQPDGDGAYGRSGQRRISKAAVLLAQLGVVKNGQTTIMTQDECDKLSDGNHCSTIAVPRYVTDKTVLNDPKNTFRARQCFLDPANESTWSVADACGPQPPQSHLIWWDTFAIPSARVGTDNQSHPRPLQDAQPLRRLPRRLCHALPYPRA